MKTEEISTPRKVALYAYLGGKVSWFSVMEVSFVKHDEHYDDLPEGQHRELPHDGYARVSEIMEITFPKLDGDSTIQLAVKSLDETERKLIAELNEKIAGLRSQKAQLLALTHQVEA